MAETPDQRADLQQRATQQAQLAQIIEQQLQLGRGAAEHQATRLRVERDAARAELSTAYARIAELEKAAAPTKAKRKAGTP